MQVLYLFGFGLKNDLTLFFIVDITSKEITLTLEIASFQQIFEE